MKLEQRRCTRRNGPKIYTRREKNTVWEKGGFSGTDPNRQARTEDNG